MNNKQILKRSIHRWTVTFIVSLILSGATASIPIQGLAWILQFDPLPGTGLRQWLERTYSALSEMNGRYPFLLYGYDWLAFGHLSLAVVFTGILADPVRNIWLLKSGCVLCLLVIPVAFIAGSVRGIPVGWRLIDCSFGLIGLIPLIIAYRKTLRLELIQANHHSNTLHHA